MPVVANEAGAGALIPGVRARGAVAGVVAPRAAVHRDVYLLVDRRSGSA